MRKLKKLSALLLAAALVAGMFAAMPLSASAANHYDVNTATKLTNALGSGTNNIYLSGNIFYPLPIVLPNKDYDHTINLSGNTLAIDVSGVAVTLTGGARLTINGPGTLQLTGKAGGIHAIGRNTAFRSEDRGATVNVTINGGYYNANDPKQNSAVYAESGAKVSIQGDVYAVGNNSYGVYADSESRDKNGLTEVIVKKSITANGIRSVGAHARKEGFIRISDNVTASGDDSIGVRAVDKGTEIYVSENVSAAGVRSVGARAEGGGRIYVCGNISGDGSAINIEDGRENNPSRRSVILPYSIAAGYNWDEYTNSRTTAFVYKRVSGISGGWHQSPSDKKWYYYEDGKPKTGWVRDGNTWYYLKKPNGDMVENQSASIDNTWYFFRPGGAMATGWVWDNSTYYFYNSNGSRALSQWVQTGGNWYYLSANGRIATGWLTLGGVRYYLQGPNTNGAMATGWCNILGTWYYFASSGAMLSNQWVESGGVWYYLKSNGAMASNESLTLGGKTYTFAGSGACTNP